MPDQLPPLVGVLRGDVSNFVAKMGEAKAITAEAGGGITGAMGGMAAVGKAALFGVAGAAVAVGVVSVKMAGDFQSSMTQLVTGAGESKSNIDMVSKGILDMSGQVGISAQELAAGMYNIESAGYHGAQALDVLKASAQGAKVGGADMATVADALTSAMNAYRGSGMNANQMTNDLIATVASGKMHMQDLASSLGAVLPAASTAGVGLQDVSAAIATMTAQGTPAADAATYLRQTILQLENPSAKAKNALMDIGMSAKDVHKMLADPDTGLNGGLQVITEALGKKFGVGSQQYIAHLADIVGGTKSMQAALELTGPNMKTYNDNLLSIGKSTAFGKGSINGFSDVQKDFNFQVDQAKASLTSMGIQLGLVLIPYIQKGIVVVGQIIGYFKQHKDQALMVAAAVGGPLVVAIGLYAAAMIAAGIATLVANAGLILIMVAIGALAAGVIYAYNHWGWFRTAVNAAGAELKVFGGWMAANIPPLWHAFTTDISNAWNGLKAFGTWISNTFGPILDKMGQGLKTAGGFLNSINPWAKHSPSLVENVQSGVLAIAGHYSNMARSVLSSMGSLSGSPGFTGGGLSVTSSAGMNAAMDPSQLYQRLDRMLDFLELLETIATAMTTPVDVSGADGALYALIQKVMKGRARGLVGAV